jgi:hypothetical protein
MVRALGCVVLVAVATPAAADPPSKQAIAVLDIAAKEESVIGVAASLTAALRNRGKAKASRFRVVGTGKTIAAAVLKADCALGEPACMTAIGTALGADVVVHGAVSRRGGKRTLQISLFDVATQQRIRTLTDTVASSVAPSKWARAVYERLVDVELGDLVIVANASRGEVFVDGVQAAILIEGKATVARLPLGNHRVAIRARGFKAFDVELAVDGFTTHSILLEPDPAAARSTED